MMLLLDGSILCLDAILHDEMSMMMPLLMLFLPIPMLMPLTMLVMIPTFMMMWPLMMPLFFLLFFFPIDPILILRCPRWDPGIQDVVVQSCCRRCDVEGHVDVHLVMAHSLFFFAADVILDVRCQLLTCEVVDDSWSRWLSMRLCSGCSMTLFLAVIDVDHAYV